MKSKKLLALICASVLAIGALTACSSNEAPEAAPEVTTPAEEATTTEEAASLTDGTYRAEYDKEDSHGWKAFVEVTVEGGQMTAVNFDYINADGAFKSEDAGYNTQMKDIIGISPAEFKVALADSLIATQNPAKIDAVTGATISSDEFVAFTTALMEQMQAGNTEVLVIAAPAE